MDKITDKDKCKWCGADYSYTDYFGDTFVCGSNNSKTYPIGSYQSELCKATCEKKAFEDKLAHMRDCYDIQRKTMHKQDDEIRRWKEAYAEMELRNKHLQQAVDYNVKKIKSLGEMSDKQVQEIARIHKENDDRREDGKTVRAHLAAAEAAKDYWHKASIAKEKDIILLKKTIDAIDKDRQALHDQLHAAQRPLVDENAKLKKKVEKLERQVSSYDQLHTSQATTIANKRNEITRLNDDLAVKQVALDMAEKERDSLKEQLLNVSKQNAEEMLIFQNALNAERSENSSVYVKQECRIKALQDAIASWNRSYDAMSKVRREAQADGVAGQNHPRSRGGGRTVDNI